MAFTDTAPVGETVLLIAASVPVVTVVETLALSLPGTDSCGVLPVMVPDTGITVPAAALTCPVKTRFELEPAAIGPVIVQL